MGSWGRTGLLLLLSACAATPEAPSVVPEPEASKPISSVEPLVPEAAPPKPVAKPAHPKVKRRDRAAEKTPPPKSPEAAQSAPSLSPPVPPPEPQAAPQPIRGPAWLARCASKSREGGVILCDADSLLVQPSPSVKVYTREAALAGKVASGVIVLRANLPRRYRIYFVP